MKTELKTIRDLCNSHKSTLVDSDDDSIIMDIEAHVLCDETDSLVGWISFEDMGDYVTLYFLEVFPEYRNHELSLILLSLMPKKPVHLMPLNLDATLYFTHVAYTGYLVDVVFEDK